MPASLLLNLVSVCSILIAIISISVAVINSEESNDDDTNHDLFFDDNGAWLMLRKIVIGFDNKFGVSYDFVVRYEIRNIGTLTATNITITDAWDWTRFQPINIDIESTSNLIIFNHEKLEIKESMTFECTLRPLVRGRYFPLRANVTYFVENEFLEISSLSSSSSSSNTKSKSKSKSKKTKTNAETAAAADEELASASDLDLDLDLDLSSNLRIYGESSNYMISGSYLEQYSTTHYLSQTHGSMLNHNNLNTNSKQYLLQQQLMSDYQELYHMQVHSSAVYSRAISTKFFYWVLFLVSCGLAVVYPLSVFERCKGNIAQDISFFKISDIGEIYVLPLIQYMNYSLVPRMKAYFNPQSNTTPKRGSKTPKTPKPAKRDS